METSKVYIIHENLEWTQHLVNWLEHYEIPYELMFIWNFYIDIKIVIHQKLDIL